MCKQHSHLCFAGFSGNIALVHWILHCLTWILHIKKAAVNWKARYIWHRNIACLKGWVSFKRMLHLSEDSSIVFRGIENIILSQGRMQLNETCFFTNRGHFIVAFNNILHFRTGMHYHVKVMLNIMDTCFPSREGSISLFKTPCIF